EPGGTGLAERHRWAARDARARPARMLEAEASPGAPERPYSGSRVGRSRTPSRGPSPAVAFVSGDLLAYSGGPAPDSHRLPVRPTGRTPIECVGRVYGPDSADVKDSSRILLPRRGPGGPATKNCPGAANSSPILQPSPVVLP